MRVVGAYDALQRLFLALDQPQAIIDPFGLLNICPGPAAL